MSNYLILACKQELLTKNVKNIFLTQETYSLNEKQLSKFDVFTLKSHWQNKKKRKKDYFYIKKTYYSVLNELKLFLNKYHKLKYSTEEWHLIIGPWLNYLLPILWDRWETISNLKKKKISINKIVTPDQENKVLTSLDFNNFISNAECQIWNSKIFETIIDYNLFPRDKYIKRKVKIKKEDYKTQKNMFLTFIDNILRFLQNFFFKSNIAIISGNFEKEFYIKNFIKNLIFPRFFSEFNSLKIIHPQRLSLKRNNSLKFKKIKNLGFENYLSKVILQFLPTSYLENFNIYLKKSFKININSKHIFSVFKHYDNELFKIWIVSQKKRLIICYHGANIEKEIFFNSWQKYGFKTISWNRELLEANQINLPPNFLLFRKRNFKRHYLNFHKILFLLPHCETKPLRLVDGLFCFEVIIAFDSWINFYKKTNLKIKNNIVFRYGPFVDRWNIKDKLKKKLIK